MSRHQGTRCLARGQFYGRVATHREVAGLRMTDLHHAHAAFLPQHTHECPHFWLLLTGAYREHLGSIERPHRPFSFGYCPAGVEHQDEIGHVGARLFAIEFDAHTAQMIADVNRPMSTRATEIHETLAFSSLLQLHSEFLRARAGGYALDCLTAETLMAELIGYAFEPRARPANRQPRWLAPVIEYLDAHYVGLVRISALAASAGVHPVHLARVFREVHRCSIAQYLTILRVRRACALLGVGDLTLSQIALHTGFSDQSHFTRAFTATVGASPGVFRRAVFS
ncbi:MAG TPA: AraC family transcriptional regulator [Gemmatimonadaceae bacterium]|nr:AraC family transcriptional regulator [Gemmatimonadaceae bacterium]